MRYLGILRDTQYSPNMADLDAAIFREVAALLAARGAVVDCIPEGEMLHAVPDGYDAVLTMARNVENLGQFRTTLPCYNSTEGILACSRKGVVADTLARVGVPQPPYIIAGDARARDADFFPLWVKNGEGCTRHRADTTYVANAGELCVAVANLVARGVGRWLLQQHIVGDLVKFYGVEGTGFFHWCYPDASHSKLGQEALNGETRGYAFSPGGLKEMADRAARALGVPIYGGGCIVDARGSVYLIDFSGWPSFYCCRQEAAQAIAERVARL